jgi:hypothetical protein
MLDAIIALQCDASQTKISSENKGLEIPSSMY